MLELSAVAVQDTDSKHLPNKGQLSISRCGRTKNGKYYRLDEHDLWNNIFQQNSIDKTDIMNG